MRTLALLCLLPLAASAQTFERFGVRDGLPSELINDVELGPDGLLWIATDDGLARYDGHGFRVWRHRTDDPASIPSSRVITVRPQGGTVWVGTTNGLAALDLQSGRATTIDTLPRAVVQDVAVDVEGRVWVGYVNRGLWRYTPATGRVRPARLAPTQRLRVLVLATHGDDVWVEVGGYRGDPGQVCRLDRDRAVCAESRQVEPWRLLEAAGEAVLLYRTPGEPGWVDWLSTQERWAAPPGTPMGDVFRSTVRVAPGEAWFRASPIAVLRADGTTRTLQADPDRRDGIGGFDARTFVRDRQGNVWVGTEAGLFLARQPAKAFTAVRHIPGDASSLSDDRVNGMAQDAAGRLWVATNGGLNRVDLATGRVTRLGATNPRESVTSSLARAFWQVLPLDSSRVLVGLKRGGVARWDGARLETLDVPGFGEGSGLRSLVRGGDGEVWAASESLARVESEGGTRIALPLPPGVPVNVVQPGIDGALWIGTDDGVYRRDGTEWQAVAPDALCGANVWSMAASVADPGAVWIATVGGGLARVDLATEDVTCVTARDGLPTNSVYGVLADDEGDLWASTTSGLARVDPVTRDVVTFSSADGLAGDAFNLMAQLRLRDGRLAFGGPDGLTIVDPRAVARRAPPDVVVTGVELRGRLLKGTPREVLTLAHDAGSFGVRFAAVDFRAPRRNRYRYRLVGFDEAWQRTDGSAPRAVYARLPPGTYRFEVQAAAADTPFAETPATLDIEIVPALWQRPSVQAGVGALAFLLLFAGGLAAVYRRRRAAERERTEAAEIRRQLAGARERERVRLAQDLHDGPVQTLYRVGHDLDRLGDGALSERVGPVRARVGDVAGELRQMLVELRPTLVEHLGLAAALRTVGRRAEDRFPELTVEVHDAATHELASAARLALFRITQEALQNAGRHAGPARVAIRLRDEADGVRLTVRDDGRGFAVPERMVALARSHHFGLVGAKERAEAVGGTFGVRSVPGAGTEVTAWVPAGDGA